MKLKVRRRSDSVSPLSASWTLYRPEDVAEKLVVPLSTVDKVLEETGFSKAVRIREEIIRLKTRLISEARELHHRERRLTSARLKNRDRLKSVNRQLADLRQILRLPREKGGQSS